MSSTNFSPFGLHPQKGLLSAMKETTLSDPSERPSGSKTYLLIVNGSANDEDSISMGDWMGFCRIFQNRGSFGGDFWTVTDPDKHLESIGLDDIKFGRTTTDRTTGETKDDYFESISLYTKGEQANDAWFEVEDKSRVKNRFLRWIGEKARLAQKGDSVNIIICGHGRSIDGAVRLGQDWLTPEEYVKAIGAFGREMDVNTIYNGCYAGYFVDAVEETNVTEQQRRFIHVPSQATEMAAGDIKSPSGRYRSSPFGRTWVKSMIGITLERGRTESPSPSKKHRLSFPAGGVTIQSHDDAVRAAVTNRNNPKFVSHSRLYFAPPPPRLHWTALLSTVLLRKYVDVAFDPREGSLRRRVDSHTSKVVQRTVTKPWNPSQNAIDKAMFLCHEENQRFDDDPIPRDNGIWYTTSKKDTCLKGLPGVLINLYWRARKQIAIFEVYCMLYEHQQVTCEALAIPINYRQIPSNVLCVLRMLSGFSKLADLEEPPYVGKQYSLIEFGDAVQWLAAMICRSCHNLTEVNDVISLIAHSHKLGRLDADAVSEINEKRAKEVESLKGKNKGKGKAKMGHSEQGSSAKSGDKARQDELKPFFKWDETANAAKKQSHEIFGLMLPSGRGSDIRQLYHDINESYDHIESVYRDFFGLTTEDLAIEDEDIKLGWKAGA